MLVNLSEKKKEAGRELSYELWQEQGNMCQPSTGQANTEEREGGRLAMWHGQLTSTVELHAGARPTQQCAQSEEGKASGQSERLPGKQSEHSSACI